MADTSDGDRRVHRGQVIRWAGQRYRVAKRREVDGMAMFQIGTHEVFLTGLGAVADAGWVPEGEVEPADADGTP